MTITLNVKQGVLDAAAAFTARTLAAQHKNMEGCYYRGEDGSPCVVGAMISDEDWDRDVKDKIAGGGQANEMGVEALIDDGIVKIDLTGLDGVTSNDARLFLSALQDDHDRRRISRLGGRLRRSVEAVKKGTLPKFRA